MAEAASTAQGAQATTHLPRVKQARDMVEGAQEELHTPPLKPEVLALLVSLLFGNLANSETCKCLEPLLI